MLLNRSINVFKPLCFSFFSFVTLCLISTATYSDETNISSSNNTHIRTLAASCAACHGTNGNSLGITPVLAGLDSHYFSTQMLAFKKHSRDSTVMHHHATGITATEINQLADYFSLQKRISKPPLTSEALKDNKP